MTITHAFISAVPDGGDSSLVQPSNWNAAHTIGAGTVTEAMLSISANTTGNVSNTAHGFAPILPNDATKFLNGVGAYATPSIGTPITASLGGDVALNNTSTYFDGPSVAQGSVGVWLAVGSVQLNDSAGAANFNLILWDGTTVIASAQIRSTLAGVPIQGHLSGLITSPAGNLRISVKDITATTGAIAFNTSGNSKDSTITATRVA